jgi:hypothetical protein
MNESCKKINVDGSATYSSIVAIHASIETRLERLN